MRPRTDLDLPSRTGALRSAKARDEVSEAALAHTIKDRVKAAYLRTDFFEERKSLMEAWSTSLPVQRSAEIAPNADPQPLSVLGLDFAPVWK